MAGAAISGVWADRILRVVEPLLYGRRRRLTHIVLLLLTAVFAVQSARLAPDAGWLKMIPLSHPYMQKFREYYRDFGGANTVVVALMQPDGDIYNAHFMGLLQHATDDVFFIPGIDRARVMSLFTPNVNYVENVEGGLSGATVIPPDYQPTPAVLQKVRSNVGKAQVIGRLVSNDQRGALILSELLDVNPQSGRKLDYREVGAALEKLRARYEAQGVRVAIIGFAKIVDDMARASAQVGGFFFVALLFTGVLLWLYLGSWRLALIPLGSSFVAVIWEMGLLRSLGFGLDPFAILVPFLILSVSVSHGIQYVASWVDEVRGGRSASEASLQTFRRLAIAGTIALLTDVAGFATIYLIDIQTIREMSINAVLGGLAIIIANKMLVPIWLCHVRLPHWDAFIARQDRRERALDGVRWWLSGVTRPAVAAGVLVACAAGLGASLWARQGLIIGDAQKGVPELRPDSRFNRDVAVIDANFDIGVDALKVIAESRPNGCIDYQLMDEVDRFSWHMDNTPGVLSSLSVLTFAKLVYQGLSEGRLNALVLPRNHYALAQATALVPTSSGLLNDDCDALAIHLFTRDHRAGTIQRIVDEVKRFNAANAADFYARSGAVSKEYCDAKYAAFEALKGAQLQALRVAHDPAAANGAAAAAQKQVSTLQAKYDGMPKDCPVNFALATGNIGVMAATNEVVRADEGRVVAWVYAAILVLLWMSFRSWRGICCIVVPLALVSEMGYAVMAGLHIGMKVATLPVLALAVGIGVDYGIYVYGVLSSGLREGLSLREAYHETLRGTGKAVVFTALALAAAVATWLFSQLQFQVDMGRLLLFMFTANMIGAIVVLPAIAAFVHADPRPAPDRPPVR